MGTQLLAWGLASGECGMCWNLERPGDVSGIHQAYRNAGCDLITTNSFGGSRFALERHGLTGAVTELNRAAGKAMVIVQPNAGSRRTENGRTIYDATPEQMGATANRLLAAGVRILGGCCGTTPDHLAAMSRVVRAVRMAN